MKKPQLTREEEQQRLAEIEFRRKYEGYKRRLKTMCEGGNLRAMELKLEYLKQHPNTILPEPEFNHEQTVNA